MRRSVLRGANGRAKVCDATDRLVESQVEHVHAIPHLRSQPGQPERGRLRQQAVSAEQVPRQDRAPHDTNLPGSDEGEPGERTHSHHQMLPHEQYTQRQAHAQNEHKHFQQQCLNCKY